MRYFGLTMVVTLVLGLVILLPVQTLSGTNSAEVTNVTQRPHISVPSQVVDEITVNSNTYQIKELSTKNIVVIQLNTEVTEETVDLTIAKIKAANKSNKKSIFLKLTSPGGSVFDGQRLITAMESSKIPVYTVGVDFCASMCAHILEHGKERYMTDRSRLMFHPASTGLSVEGEVDKIYSRLGAAKRSIDKLDMYDANRSGQKYVEFKAKRDSEYWTDAEDALHDHLIDAVVNIDFEKEILPLGPQVGNKFKLDLKD